MLSLSAWVYILNEVTEKGHFEDQPDNHVEFFYLSLIHISVFNAFCHRDYSVMGRIRVAVEDEGLTIANPGGVIEGVTLYIIK